MINWVLLRTHSSKYDPGLCEEISISDQQHHASISSPDSKDINIFDQLVKEEQTTSGASFNMMVVTAVKDGRVERSKFPYWSWVPCLICERPRPPRCHHCTLCNQCVLKRDHHCYFTGSCVGVNNQKFFLFYLFWALQIAILAITELLVYYSRRVLPETSVWDLLFPVNVYHVMTGRLSVVNFYFILVLWGVGIITPITLGMFSVTLFLTLRGITKFEFDHNIQVKDTRSIAGRLRAVLGSNWGFTLIFPLGNSGRVQEDAVNWPYIKL